MSLESTNTKAKQLYLKIELNRIEKKYMLVNDYALKDINISEMGLEGQSSQADVSLMDETKSSIDLYNDYIFDLDETPEVSIAFVFITQFSIGSIFYKGK